MVRILAAALLLVIGCAYDARYEDCAIQCTPDTGCPEDMTCGAEGLCRDPSAPAACSVVLDTAPSCRELPKTCGPASNEDCCSTATTIPGGSFYRSYDTAADGMYANQSYPATVSAFNLDRFEVTVGRFRKFVEAGMGTRLKPPSSTEGAHAHLSNSGWDPNWNSALESDRPTLETALICQDPAYASWSLTPGAHEDLPINCVTWFEAMAFCAWDGGFLPTETEWNFAASAGSEQRSFPWSNPGSSLSTDCSRANYMADGVFCVPGTGGAVAFMNHVGNESPRGDGKWGQTDLGGNVWEWTLDWQGAYLSTCSDCASLNPSTRRVIRGGDFSHDHTFMRTAHRGLSFDENTLPGSRTRDVGFRCAREIP